MSKAFQLLHPAVQRKLWDMRWTELRPIQVDAIEHLLGGTPTDCIISSPTASGKTEAAFLPVLSALADEPSSGIRAMYIGPLKALINDQFGRIEALCARMEMPVHRWHGDVDDGARKSVLASPAGILLITPESLEAMFVLRPAQLPALFGRLAYVVIDETHAFLGTERGAQLISQLHRLRIRAGTDPIRIGLSATLGDRDAACRWLRRDGRPVRVIDAPSGSSEIMLRVRGFWRQQPAEDRASDEVDDPALVDVARSILLACHGKTNLVFANAKSTIEALADELANQAKASALADEIVVHHGSLSKDQRQHAEERLRTGRPCTAVCSNTLELGIDIGSIDEVVQVSPPWSVASLVQRLGRSGRRAGSARILRGFFIENVPGVGDDVWERLHLPTIRGLASIELMLENWLEPPEVDRANLSTSVQQILSILAETGGIRAHELYPRLAESGAFPHLNRGDFAKLLRELGARDLVEQLADSTLVLGLKAQRVVEHYSFYAAFKSPSEFQVLHRERSIGALPEGMLPGVGEHVILAGRRWLVEDIDVDRRQVFVSPSRGRRPPRFSSTPGDVASTLHARMRALLCDDARLEYIDDVAFEIVRRARAAAREANIDRLVQVSPDRSTLSLWAGSKMHRALSLLFASAGLRIEAIADVALHVHAPIDNWSGVLRRFVENPDASTLAAYAEDKLHARVIDGEKFDVFVPGELWRRSFVRDRLDVESAVRVARRILSEAALLSRSNEPPRLAATVVSIPDVERWADAIAAMPAPSPLPARIVLVPSEAHAHALRSELATRAPRALAGTRFFTAAAAARAVLDAAGTAYSLGEEQRRPLRLRKLFRSQPSLTSYRVEDLGAPGWEEAFASTIEQLEAAAVSPEDLERLGEPRAIDLAAIWRAIDVDAGTSWTVSRIMAEALALLRAEPAAWPFDAHTLAPVPIGIDTIHARFVSAIPRLTLGIVPGRPAQPRAIDRLRALLGEQVASLIATVNAESAGETELGILGDLLFEAPARIAAPDRRRSRGPDGSVSLELHAGVDEELDAAARWVAEQVFDHRTPLQEIAVLVPTPDPLATLVADRLRAMAWPPDVEPVYLASGRPAVATASGARLLSVVNAVGAFLPADAVVELLPRLRLHGSDGHVTPGRARAIAAMLGTLGGSPSRPTDALRWRDRLRCADLDESARMLAPAIDALVAIAGDVIAGAPLRASWEAIREFTMMHVIAAGEISNVLVQLGDEVSALVSDPVTDGIVGVEAIEVVASLLGSMRLREGRYGMPAIYVGPITDAAGLRFAAVRVLGLTEGAFPGTLREDAILPADMRRRLPGYAMASDDDYATSRLHAFDQIVRGTQERLALSTPRMDLDGSEREPASLFVEAAAALGRPNALTGAPGRVVPTMSDLDRDAFRISRAASAARRAEVPLTARCWMERVADKRDSVPSGWSQPVINPIEIIVRSDRMDGVLGPEPLTVDTFGTSSELPLSASALRMLLTCPQRFLLERMLRMRPRSASIEAYRLDPASYGVLFHQVAGAFAQAHGEDFGARRGELAGWLDIADDLACATFDAFLDGCPLVGDAAIQNERRRLRRDLRTLIELDWSDRPRRFVAAELTFGQDSPVSIPTSQGDLFVTGRIDRIDVDGDITLVRDLKTGRAHPREADHIDPEVDLDLQLAVYAAVARSLAPRWSIPGDIAAAYVYTDPSALVHERAFTRDRLALCLAGQRWFDLAMSLIHGRLYVKTPSGQDCARCPFRAVCGDRTAATAERLRDATGALATFRDLGR